MEIVIKNNLLKIRKSYILKYVSVICFSFFVFTVKSQQLPSDSAKGLRYYNDLNYSQALSYLLKYNKSKQTQRNTNVIADCFRHIQNYSESEKWYKRAVEFKNPSSKIRFYYAEALQQNGKYFKAIKEYLLTKPVDEKEVNLVEKRTYSCEISDSLFHLPNRFLIQKAKTINTYFSEIQILPYGVNKILVSDRLPKDSIKLMKTLKPILYGWTERGFLKLFLIKGDSLLTQTEIIPFDSIHARGQYHIGPIVFNKKQDLVFYTISKKINPRKLTADSKKIKDFINRLEIFYSQKLNGHWTIGTPVPFNNVLEYSVGHPALSPNDSLLYFASDMPGGKGGTDIYYSEIGNLTFSKPVNAGQAVNTEGDEKFPVFQPNGDLYFSSDGLPGLGGLDVFRTRGEKSNWLKPDNLGYPINSSNDDFDFLTQGKDIVGGYFASNRVGGTGNDDLYSFQQIKPLKPLEKSNSDQSSKDSIAEVRLQMVEFHLDSVEYLAQFIPLINIKSKNPENKFTNKNLVFLKGLKSKKFHVNNIGNDFDKYALDSASMKEVDSVALILLNHPGAKLKIIGHADSRGSKAYNLALSKKRALAVSERLKQLGINPKRLIVSWAGSSNALANCPPNTPCTEQQYANQRKTELSITGISNYSEYEDLEKPNLEIKEIIKSKDIVKSVKVEKTLADTVVRIPLVRKIIIDSIQNKNFKINQVTKNDIKVLQDSLPNHRELFEALGEMSIDTVFLTSRNLLIIRETDGTIQRIFIPSSLLVGDQLIQDQLGNKWIIRRDRKIIKIKSEKDAK